MDQEIAVQPEVQVESNEITENAHPPKDEVVPKNELKRVLDDMHKYKKMAKELEDKIKQSEVQAMKNNQEWQKIAEIKEREAQEAHEKYERFREGYVSQQKYSALKEQALKAGLRADAVDMLDLLPTDEIQVEYTSTGKMNILGVSDVVQRLKMTRPFLFDQKSSKINPSSPETVNAKAPSWEDVKKAEAKAKRTGDYAPYQKLLLEWSKHN